MQPHNNGMKKLFILGIIGVLTISLIGCETRREVKINGLSKYVSNDISVGDINGEIIDKKIDLNDAKNIDIEIFAAVVSIKAYDGDEVKITGKLSERSKGIDVNKNGDKISIIEKGDSFLESIINDKNNFSKFDILVPLKFKGDLKFKQGAGKSNIEGLKLKDLKIIGGAGELKCEDIMFDKLNLNSGVGQVDLNLNEKCGDIDINGGVGETNIEMAEVGGNLKYKGGVGSTTITIPKNSPVRFISEKGVGNCDINAKTSGEDTYVFDLKIGVGSINIRN